MNYMERFLPQSFQKALFATACFLALSNPYGARAEDEAPLGIPGLLATESQPTQFDLNDVSFLFPIPESSDDLPYLLNVDSPGRGGFLMPADTRELIASRSDIPGLYVVAARVDHCFPGDEPGSCQRQLRITGQPLRVNPQTGEITADDRSIHLFYQLTNWNFKRLVAELRELKKLSSGETVGKPLSVHPVMQAEGLSGPYAQKLNSIISAFAGEENFIHVARITQAGPGRVFIQEDVDSFPVPIPGTLSDPAPLSLFMSGNPGFGSLLSDRLQDASVEDLWRHQTGSPSAQLNQAELEHAVNRSFFFDNPLLSDVKTLDCFSCHFAERVRRDLVADPELALSETAFADEYLNAKHDLTATHNGLPIHSEKMFGYTGRAASVAVRVVNESAVVADALSKRRFQPERLR